MKNYESSPARAYSGSHQQCHTPTYPLKTFLLSLSLSLSLSLAQLSRPYNDAIYCNNSVIELGAAPPIRNFSDMCVLVTFAKKMPQTNIYAGAISVNRNYRARPYNNSRDVYARTGDNYYIYVYTPRSSSNVDYVTLIYENKPAA